MDFFSAEITSKLCIEIQGEVTALQTKPILIQKQADRVGSKLEQLQDMYQNICQKQLDNMDNFRSFSGKIGKLENELNSLIRDEAKMAQQKKNAVRDVERFMGQMESLITREQIMIDKVWLILTFFRIKGKTEFDKCQSLFFTGYTNERENFTS